MPGAVLLITATVAPAQAAPLLVVRDPARRQQEYLDALGFYMQQSGSAVERIVFAENSDADPAPFVHLAKSRAFADRFEFLSVTSAPPELGRGVGEAHIVDVAMKQSTTIARLPDSNQIWKITGRYTVRNLTTLISTAPATELYINLRRWPTTWCDTYAYAFTRPGYARHLASAAALLQATPSAHGEVVMAELVEGLLRNDAAIVPRFRREPRVEGVRGWDQASYASKKQRVKYLARVAGRRAAPWIWL